jgi:hypothetical protein
MKLAFHGLDDICHFEWSFRLSFDLVHCDTFGQFDQCKAISEIDIKDTLGTD